MSGPSVSVVVPTHDRAGLLPRLLRSVLGQSLDDLELLVVDDGSSDATTEVLGACDDPRLRVLRHETARGVAAARNTGTRAARGRWVAWCDDDDVWAPDKLRLQLEALAASPGARWSNTGAVYVDGDLRLTRLRRCPDPATITRDLLRVNAVAGGGSGVLADRELALATGGFDTSLSMYADWDMWVRLAHAAPLAVVDLPLIGYVQHSGGMSQGSLHLALDELDRLSARLDRLAEAAGLDERLDRRAVGLWVLRQQTGSGSRLDTFRLPYRLARHRMMDPRRVVPYSVAAAVAPDAMQRRWDRRRLRDERYRAYAQAWLSGSAAAVPAAEVSDPPRPT